MPETTSNGHEIEHPVEKISALEFRKKMAKEYGLNEGSPAERVARLQDMSVEGVAILLEDINKSLQGSRDSLMNHERAMLLKNDNTGDVSTIKPEDRPAVFLQLIESIRNCSPDVNPARIGDVLALGVVMLHPFYDGNGRTARVLGLMFREDYDSDPDEFGAAFDVVAEPRDKARERGGFMIYGYVPELEEGMDRSNPGDVSRYLDSLLQEEKPGAYVGCFGPASLYETPSRDVA